MDGVGGDPGTNAGAAQGDSSSDAGMRAGAAHCDPVAL